MVRTRLLGAALLVLALLSSGCRLFDPDRPRFLDRCRERHSGQANAAPVSYAPVDAGCGATVIPPASGGIYGQPITLGRTARARRRNLSPASRRPSADSEDRH